MATKESMVELREAVGGPLIPEHQNNLLREKKCIQHEFLHVDQDPVPQSGEDHRDGINRYLCHTT